MADQKTAPSSAAPPSGENAAASGEVFSQRLLTLLDDVLAGDAPNAGRFCGYCYHPLAPERQSCPHCSRSVAECPSVSAVPRPIIELHRRRRGREGLVVRTVAWGGLSIGVIAALLPLAFWNVYWWTVVAFFGLLVFFYLLSANLANSLGDSLGYAWGQALVRRGWAKFIARRDAAE